MTQGLGWLIGLIAAALGTTIALFRKGGPYNPKDMVSTDHLSTVPDPAVIPASPVVIAPSAQKQPTQPLNQPKATYANFCDSIVAMEGANPANNNEGNCRCSPVGYLPMYGNVTCNPHGFAVFPTKALGRTYLENMIKAKVHNHPNQTILQFMSSYAPSTDGNDPVYYSQFIAKRLGVDNSFLMKSLV